MTEGWEIEDKKGEVVVQRGGGVVRDIVRGRMRCSHRGSAAIPERRVRVRGP